MASARKKWGREGAGWAEEFTKKLQQSQRVTWLSVLAAPRIATDAHKPANEPKGNIIESASYGKSGGRPQGSGGHRCPAAPSAYGLQRG